MSPSPASQYWMDGTRLSDLQISLGVESPVLQAGEGWFETLRVEQGSPLRLAGHLDRLRASLASAGQASEVSWDDLQSALEPALMAARDYPRGRLRITLLPSAIANRPLSVLVSLAEYTPPEEAYQTGLSVVTSRLPHPRMGYLGKSLSYHWSRAAQREARAAGADEALFAVDWRAADGSEAGPIAAGALDSAWLEASTASLLWPDSDGWCSTSGIGGTLPSVTLQGLRQSGLAIKAVSSAPRTKIFEQGLLLVSALRLVVAVRGIDGRALPDLTTAATELRGRLLGVRCAT